MMSTLKKIYYLIIGKKLPARVEYTISSHIKISDLPKGRWTFVSTKVIIDEVGGYWLEDTMIIDEETGKTKKKIFAGYLDDLILSSKRITYD